MKKISLFVIAVVSLASLAGCKWCCCSHSHDAADTKKIEASEGASTVVVESVEGFEKEVIKSDKPVIADFSAQWCHACQTMKPLFEELAKEYSTYKFVTINVDSVEKIAHEYNVSGIPMFAFFNAGKEINKGNRIVGAVSKEDFKKAIEKAFKS